MDGEGLKEKFLEIKEEHVPRCTDEKCVFDLDPDPLELLHKAVILRLPRCVWAEIDEFIKEKSPLSFIKLAERALIKKLFTHPDLSAGEVAIIMLMKYMDVKGGEKSESTSEVN
jgi:hypothetical protein